MKSLLRNVVRLYFQKFPVRKGKIPLMNLFDKLGIFKNYQTTTSFDQNIKLKVDLNDWIQKQIYLFGYYEVEKIETDFWNDLIKENFIVFDVGANIGYYSLLAAKRIGGNGRVYSFEPIKNTFNRLNENISLNNFENIKIHNIALSDKEKEIEIFLPHDSNTGMASISSEIVKSSKKEIVKAITLDNFIRQEKIEKVDIIKIDVEGSELFVLKGMSQILEKMNPIILIEVLNSNFELLNYTIDDIYEYFNKFKYNAYEIINKRHVKKLKTNIEGGLILFSKDDNKIIKDLIIQP